MTVLIWLRFYEHWTHFSIGKYQVISSISTPLKYKWKTKSKQWNCTFNLILRDHCWYFIFGRSGFYFWENMSRWETTVSDEYKKLQFCSNNIDYIETFIESHNSCSLFKTMWRAKSSTESCTQQIHWKSTWKRNEAVHQ